MKAVLVGGAATSPLLERELQLIKAPVFATYGMTETVSHIALRRLNGQERSHWFTALDGVELGVDERGCLHITSAATNFERVQTNDVVEFRSQASLTQFQLLGRADTIINSGGVKIQPEQVERVAQEALAIYRQAGTASPGEDQASWVPRLFVAAMPDERLGQRVVLVLEQRALSPEQFQTVQESIRLQLGPYAVPKDMVVVPELAETSTGKIDRNATIARIR